MIRCINKLTETMVCLSFSSHSRIFHLLGDVTISGEELQILTYARHLWQLSSEGSLACPTLTVTQGIHIEWPSPRTVTLTPIAERLALS